MASTHKHIRSSTANKRPTTAIADGQVALNTNAASPGLFFKDSTGASIIKIGPVHVGSTAPNATPGAGGSAGNSTGENWLDNSLSPVGVKTWDGSAWVNATPAGSTTVQGLLELATNAETQAGSDTARAVTSAGLQSKVSDSTSTTSSTTIASSTAVKAAYDLAAAALPLSGGIITGNLEIGTTGSLSFEGSTADAFETTIAVTNPTADRTITLPDTTGTVVTTGDTGTVTSTMIADGTIVNGDINPSAAIAHSKLANITAGQVLLGNASNVPTATALSGDVTVNSSGVTAISSDVIVNADVNPSAAIAGTKISPDFGSQTITTTGVVSAALGAAATPSITFTGDLNTGIYSPGADQVAVATNGVGRITVDSSGNVNIDSNTLYVDATNNRVGVGTTSPGSALEINAAAATSPFIAKINTAEAARIDSSGRLLVGTTSTYNVGSTVGATLQAVATSSVLTGSFTRYTNDNDGAIIALGKSRGTSAGSFTVVQSGDIIGNIRFAGADGGDLETQAASIRCEVDGTPGANDMPGRLVFSTATDASPSVLTERMRIDSQGITSIYSTGDPVLGVRSSRAAAAVDTVYTGYHSATSTTTGTLSFRVYTNGNVQNTNGSYTTISDAKLKENIVDAGSQWDDLKAIQIRNWNFKAETGHETHRQIGPIAQELETVCPGLVFETPDRDEDGNETGEVTKGVNQSVLYMKAVKALQEAMERIEQLEAAVTALQQS